MALVHNAGRIIYVKRNIYCHEEKYFFS